MAILLDLLFSGLGNLSVSDVIAGASRTVFYGREGDELASEES